MSAAQDDDTRDGVWAPRFAPVAQIIPPNVFADMDVKVAAAVASGADVIDLAKGNPDAYPAEFIRDVAKSSVDDPLNARYTPFDGKPAFLQAAANWYRNVHGVELDWRSQLFAVEGAVDGLAGLFAILIDRGDAVAFADPYYPSYHCMSVMHGAEEILLPARAELGWLPDLDAVDESVWRRLRMLILNYPNNPTGAQAPASFFEHAVELAKRYGFLIVHDFAYTGLGVSDQQVSLLTVPGAPDVSVEVDFTVEDVRDGRVEGRVRRRKPGRGRTAQAIPLSDGFDGHRHDPGCRRRGTEQRPVVRRRTGPAVCRAARDRRRGTALARIRRVRLRRRYLRVVQGA